MLIVSLIVAVVVALGFPKHAQAQILDAKALALKVEPPYELGEALGDGRVWSITDRTGAVAGYMFQTTPLAPLPGFSGEPINVLVTVDLEGRFLRADLIAHNEPVFVSGLGEAPFHEFVSQYRGLSVFDSITVGVPYGSGDRDSSGHVYLDGVTKATASVRIAHESILAAALAVAREHMQGIGGGPAPRPKRAGDPGGDETLRWADLVETGLATRFTITNAALETAFAGSLWEDDDPEAAAAPEGVYLDLYIVDVGPEAVARAVLDRDTLAERAHFLSIATDDEPILLLANGRHGLVSETFVRNTSPDLLFAHQDGLPVALRDADIEVGTAADVPDFEHRMILRTDRRLGFDPTRDWDLTVRAVRAHGVFRPELGTRDFVSTQRSRERRGPAPAPRDRRCGPKRFPPRPAAPPGPLAGRKTAPPTAGCSRSPAYRALGGTPHEP
ncbi:MAG: hypothetical protein AAFV62_07050 [Pseudomonadota bacterium]